jgi:hypothetical protein
VSSAEAVFLELVLVACEGLGDGVGLQLFPRFFVHPKLAEALVLDFDPILETLSVEHERGFLGVTVTHNQLNYRKR